MPLTSSMTKNGRPVSVAPASSTLAMFGWSIRARACRSASNRARTVLESIPALISLSATCRLTGCGLLGEVDAAHAPFADLLAELVPARDDGADDRAGGGLVRAEAGRRVRSEPAAGRSDFASVRSGSASGGAISPAVRREGPLQRAGRLVVGGQQFLQALAQLRVVAALPVEEGGPVGRVGQVEGGVEQGLDAARIERHREILRGSVFQIGAIQGRGVSRNQEKIDSLSSVDEPGSG